MRRRDAARALGRASLALLTLGLCAPTSFAAPVADFGQARPAPAVRTVVAWVLRSNDHRGRDFAVLDKTAATLYVFAPDGRLRADTPVLLGLARGDATVPGIGERPMAQVRPFERTTPAGRFELEAGRNTDGEDILWVDYAAAVSMHRLRALNPAERRMQRMASPDTKDNRISYGCINVPVAFYDGVLSPTFRTTRRGQVRGVVYILPDERPLAQVFPGIAMP